MRHEYYSYTKEQLLKNPKLPLICMENNQQIFQQMAEQMVEEIEAHNAKGEKTVFICPVGPVGQYPYFVDTVNEKNISLAHVWFINMDEYLDDDRQWVPIDHPLSFRGFMERTVYTKIKPEL
ncbi:MAG: glucosamine-6-phosphate isomerase, partial [Hungatella sp.]